MESFGGLLASEIQMVPQINTLVDTVPFTQHWYSMDWHPQDHVSFIDNVHLRPLDKSSKV